MGALESGVGTVIGGTSTGIINWTGFGIKSVAAAGYMYSQVPNVNNYLNQHGVYYQSEGIYNTNGRKYTSYYHLLDLSKYLW